MSASPSASPSVCARAFTYGTSTVYVKISLNGQQFVDTKLNFSYVLDAELQHVSPNMALNTGGTLLALNGTALKGGEQYVCRFDAGDEELFHLQGHTTPATLDEWGSVICYSPPQNPGTVALSIAMNGQQYSSSRVFFSVYTAPVIDELRPLLGPSGGGTHLQLRGSSFYEGVSYWCSFLLSAVTHVVQATKVPLTDAITCVTPAATALISTVEVSLNGIQFSSGGHNFSFHAPLVALEVSPSSGLLKGQLSSI